MSTENIINETILLLTGLRTNIGELRNGSPIGKKVARDRLFKKQAKIEELMRDINNIALAETGKIRLVYSSDDLRFGTGETYVPAGTPGAVIGEADNRTGSIFVIFRGFQGKFECMPADLISFEEYFGIGIKEV